MSLLWGRFLWRLSQSRFRSDYILKGAQLFRALGRYETPAHTGS